MVKAEILVLLESSLGYWFPDNPSEAQQRKIDFLGQEIDAAIQLIQREGITLPDCDFSIEDAQLIIMYATYLESKRRTNEPMPRMLRWALNNRLFSEKASAADAI